MITKTRNCEVCGKDCRRKKVWTQHYNKVICMNCGYTEWGFWIDGSVYSRKAGPTEAQKLQLKQEAAQ